MLEYLYTGDLSLTTDNVADVQILAEHLDVVCVIEKCQKFTPYLINSTSVTLVRILLLSALNLGHHFIFTKQI